MKKIISVILIFVMLAAAVPASAGDMAGEMSFTDVKKTSWFYEQVKYVFENGIMNGVSETKFGPNSPMSRAMFVTTLGRIANAGTKETDKFRDVKKKSWYSGYVGWAVENGIVSGYEDGTFRPDNSILRQEAAALISRYMSYRGVIFDWNKEVPGAFADAKKIPSWASNNIEELVKSGIIVGDSQGNFSPKKNITRAEAATILMRLRDAETKAFGDEVYLSAYDLVNKEGLFVSNYDSSLSETDGMPSLDLTKHEYLKAPWYFGIDFMYGDFSFSSLGYMKVCFSSDTEITSPYISIMSRPYSAEEIKPIKTDTEDGCTALTFDIKDCILAYQQAYLNDTNDRYAALKPGSEPMKNLDIRLLDSTYLRLLVYPFGNGDADASLCYICFFADRDAALEYKAEDNRDYYTSGKYDYACADIREASSADYDEAAASVFEKADEISRCESSLTPGDIKGTVYYVSSVNGKKGNDGLSPESPVLSTYDLYTYKANGTLRVSPFKEGDGVFFERGSVFYPDERDSSNYSGYGTLYMENGVSYGAYGEGPKPVFTTCLDYSGSRNWEETEYENIYKLTDTNRLCGKKDENGKFIPGFQDAGNITVFDKEGNEGFGLKVSPYNPYNPYQEDRMTWGIGENASNGFETFDQTPQPCGSPGTMLKHNLEYFHDYDASAVYMYCEGGNPAEVYDRIVITTRGLAVHGGNSNIRIDCLDTSFCGNHGIDITDGNNFEITNCDIKWIGGCYENTEDEITDGDGNVESRPSRLGNGFQNWACLNRVSVKGCLFYAIYDGACSTQVAWDDVSYVNGFYIEDCVFIDSNSHIEIWNLADNEVTANMSVKGNTFYNRPNEKRFGSQRMSGSGDRAGGGTFISGASLDVIHYENCVIEENVFVLNGTKLYANRQWLVRGYDDGYLTRNNTVIGKEEGNRLGSFCEVSLRNPGVGVNGWDIRKNSTLYTRDEVNRWVALGMDHGTGFYFVK